MTNQDRIRAFRMRLDGSSWVQIGRELNYTPQHIRQDLERICCRKPRQLACAYPVLRRVIAEDYGGSISAFADACGLSYGAMYYTLSGTCTPSQERQKDICSVIGIPPEEAFRQEEDD